MQAVKTYHQLDAYKMAFSLAMDIHIMSGNFSKVDQSMFSAKIQDAARLVSINIAEGWCRRKKSGALKNHLSYARDALTETQSWLHIGHRNENIRDQEFDKLFTYSLALREKLTDLGKAFCEYDVAA